MVINTNYRELAANLINSFFYKLDSDFNVLGFLRDYPKKPKNIGEHIRKKSMDLGLEQKDVAERLSVFLNHQYGTGSMA
jgi:hypothetical protein|tara:strand:+ start:777 stop:1013 length:237 start_codon:yes stop_codon:yes gene_type:complete